MLNNQIRNQIEIKVENNHQHPHHQYHHGYHIAALFWGTEEMTIYCLIILKMEANFDRLNK